MSVTVESLPIYFLLFVGVGIGIVLIGILRLASFQENEYDDIDKKKDNDPRDIEELFSYFLQEEEKKNQSFREMVIDVSKNKSEGDNYRQEGTKGTNHTSRKKIEKQAFNEIIERYEAGEPIEDIAKSLKKGIGEVRLVISLYSIR